MAVITAPEIEHIDEIDAPPTETEKFNYNVNYVHIYRHSMSKDVEVYDMRVT
jgi:hypothetical protein